MEEHIRPRRSVQEIERDMAKQINLRLHTKVEVTNPGSGRYTVIGSPKSVNRVVKFLTTHRLMTEDSRVYVRLSRKTVVYLKGVPYDHLSRKMVAYLRPVPMEEWEMSRPPG